MSTRVFHDPYSGLGADIAFRTPAGTRYSFVPSIGLSDKLLELSFEATPPFDTRKINTSGSEEGGDNFELAILELRVTVLWISIAIGFNRTRAGSWLNN
jgi:hypothetical protein